MNDMKSSKSDIKQMSATEKRTLAKIVDQRISLLGKQLGTTKYEIAPMIRQRIIEENNAKIAPFKKKLDDIARRAKDLKAESVKLDRAIEDAGLTTSETETRYSDKNVSMLVSVAREVTVPGIENQVRRELELLTAEHGRAGVRLEEIKLTLKEELLMGSITSSQAEEFLKRIPTIKQLALSPTKILEIDKH